MAAQGWMMNTRNSAENEKNEGWLPPAVLRYLLGAGAGWPH